MSPASHHPSSQSPLACAHCSRPRPRVGCWAAAWNARRARAILTAATAAPLIILPPLHGLAAWSYVVAVAVVLAVADMIYLPAANAVMAEALRTREFAVEQFGVFQTASSIGMALFPLTLGLLDSRTPWLLWLIATCVFVAAAWAGAKQYEACRNECELPS